MIYRVLTVLLSRHVVAHLFIPLLVGLAVEMVVVYSHGSFPPWLKFVKEKFWLILGVVITYVIIAAYYIYRDTSNQRERSQLYDLGEALATAKSFFATNTLPLKEWFEPSTQIYFARIIKQQILDKDFRHERVLLLFTDADLKNYRTPFLDEHYAKALIDIHNNYEIELAVLEREEIYEILGELSFEEKKQLNLYPFGIDWCPDFIRDRYLRIRRCIPELDFAFITHADSMVTVFPFSKRGKSQRISSSEQKYNELIAAYENLMNKIKEKIYVPDSYPPKVRGKYKFTHRVEHI